MTKFEEFAPPFDSNNTLSVCTLEFKSRIQTLNSISYILPLGYSNKSTTTYIPFVVTGSPNHVLTLERFLLLPLTSST